jgi:uncharacterized membrane protein YebE (DUF533 family)
MSAPDPTPPPVPPALQLALATKLLRSWAENRQQVQVPLALSLARLDPAPRALVVQALAAALAARGGTPEEDAARLARALPRIGGTAEDGTAALGLRPDILALLAALERAGLGAHAYASAATVLDRRVATERAFLDWLGGRLALPASVTRGLLRRYAR